MQDVAVCAFGDCHECALRQITLLDSSDHACHGGFDARDFSYHSPCVACYQRLFPPAQDVQEYELNAFLDETTNQETACDMEDLDLRTLIWGEEAPSSSEEVWQEFETWRQQVHPVVNLPVQNIRHIPASDGSTVTFRYYKPFQHIIREDEKESFREFLGLIF
jgi:hypothetical protein